MKAHGFVGVLGVFAGAFTLLPVVEAFGGVAVASVPDPTLPVAVVAGGVAVFCVMNAVREAFVT